MIYAAAAAPFVALLIGGAVKEYTKRSSPTPQSPGKHEPRAEGAYEFGGPPYGIPVTQAYLWSSGTAASCASSALHVAEELVKGERYEYYDLLVAMQRKVFPATIKHTFWLFGTRRNEGQPQQDIVAWAITAKTKGVVRWRNTTRRLDEIELCHMQVLPEYRRKGFGRGIVNFLHNTLVETIPRAEAPKRMILECKRELARRFYERCDFKPTTEPMGNAGTAPGHVWLVRDRMGYVDM